MTTTCYETSCHPPPRRGDRRPAAGPGGRPDVRKPLTRRSAAPSSWRHRKDPLTRREHVVRVKPLLGVLERVVHGTVLDAPIRRGQGDGPERVLRSARRDRRVVKRAVARDHGGDGGGVVRRGEAQQVEREEVLARNAQERLPEQV